MRIIFNLIVLILCSSFALFAVEEIDDIQFTRQLQVKDSLLLEISHSDQPKKKLELLKKLAMLYLRNDVSSGILYAEEMLKLVDKSMDSDIREIFYGEIASIFLYADVYDKALEFYFKSLQISDNANHLQYSCGMKQNIGAVYYRLHKYDQALVYLQDALKQSEELIQAGDTVLPSKLHAFYNNLGLTYQALDDKTLALQHIEKAVSLVDTADIRILSQYYTNLASLYYESGEVQKAFLYAHKNLEFSERSNNSNGVASVNFQLAYFHFKQEESKKAKELLDRACVSSEKWKYNLLLKHIYTLYVEIYEAENNHKVAIQYLKKLKNIETQLVNDQVLSKVSGLKLQYDFDKKMALQEAEIRRIELKQELSLLLVIMTVLLAIALLWIIWGRIRRIREKNERLERDLEVRNKELTTNTMSLMRNAEVAKEIITKLVLLKPNLKPGNTGVVNEVIQGLQLLTREDLWSDFEVHFNRVHLDFYKKLQRIAPDLTPTELKLCAFLRLNMSTKEISSLTQSSDRSIDVMRGRIRKKLNITNTTTNLITFLSEF